ncbi:hypothetical protein ACFOZ0_24990 [Streptomyces yaanensis]|uniref:Integral membrane protein n=1 Tax=Streptomyces yaanensis TaxID=1142239 RepID=A0ABV7SHP7_9ACTN|nr:hypothetical protein [Streptomyces sp. CGMCC 4.7035]WNC01450.1 hypothetical protein Q2K21_27195 [Streptomyces sp. CGMCC 4.7035]
MGTIVIAGTVAFILLGFNNHAWWLAAGAVLFLYAQYGRGSSSSSGPGAAPGSAATYQQYRERRDQQAKWERRYRRERPFEARRQEREKSK